MNNLTLIEILVDFERIVGVSDDLVRSVSEETLFRLDRHVPAYRPRFELGSAKWNPQECRGRVPALRLLTPER